MIDMPCLQVILQLCKAPSLDSNIEEGIAESMDQSGKISTLGNDKNSAVCNSK